MEKQFAIAETKSKLRAIIHSNDVFAGYKCFIGSKTFITIVILPWGILDRSQTRKAWTVYGSPRFLNQESD